MLTIEFPNNLSPVKLNLPRIHARSLSNPELFQAYICEGGRKSVQGWLLDGAATAVVLLSDFQQQLGIEGGMCEIGVHHGLFFIALCLLRSTKEKAVAIDVFEDQDLNIDSSGCGDFEIMIENLKKHIGCLDKIEILKSDSTKVKPADILEKMNAQKVRIFSVDGCHTKEHTLKDLKLAHSVLSPGGIIVLDDFYNPWWPGVDEAAHHLFHSCPDLNLKVIGYGDNKLFLTTEDYYEIYYQYMQDVVFKAASRWKNVTLWGHQTFAFSLFPPQQLFKRVPYWIGEILSFKIGGNAKNYQTFGWYSSEKSGTWTHSGDAVLTMNLFFSQGLDSLGKDLHLSVTGIAFLSNDLPQTSIQVICNEKMVGEWLFAKGDSLKELEALIPAEIIANNEVLEIVFRSQPSPSLKELGISQDPRQLGFFVKDMILSVV
jgi:hypothetical protein